MNKRRDRWHDCRMNTSRKLTRGLVTTCAAAALALSATTVAAAPAPVTIYTGTFAGAGKYTGSGTTTVRKVGTVRTLRLASNFRSDRRSVRLRMYLATDRTGRTFIDLGPMSKNGAQKFGIPASVKLKKYRFAIAWCAAVNEPIASAKLVAGA